MSRNGIGLYRNRVVEIHGDILHLGWGYVRGKHAGRGAVIFPGRVVGEGGGVVLGGRGGEGEGRRRVGE